MVIEGCCKVIQGRKNNSLVVVDLVTKGHRILRGSFRQTRFSVVGSLVGFRI